MHIPQPDFEQFYRACNLSKSLNIDDSFDQMYYIDFSKVRGSEILRELGRHIRVMDPTPTCQLFTGHVGCGKSTELLKLKADLQKQRFHVVYFECDQAMDMEDTDIGDILLEIARQVSESLNVIHIRTQSSYFVKLLQECASFLQTPINVDLEAKLSLGIAQITATTRESPTVRSQLRQYLEPKTSNLINAINEELIQPAIKQLHQKGFVGLVIIIDNLDRLADDCLVSDKYTLPEYLFARRGGQLRKLQCHIVYTIPMSLMFSDERESVISRAGGGRVPMVLPMIPVRFKDGTSCEEGLLALKQLVLARAFPEQNPKDRLQYIKTIFDIPETLEHLCLVSGGHVRLLLRLVLRCFVKIDTLPISFACLEKAIREERQNLVKTIEPGDWGLLRDVRKNKLVTSETRYQTLLKNMCVFEYRNDVDGCWFDVNPVLVDASELQA